MAILCLCSIMANRCKAWVSLFESSVPSKIARHFWEGRGALDVYLRGFEHTGKSAGMLTEQQCS